MSSQQLQAVRTSAVLCAWVFSISILSACATSGAPSNSAVSQAADREAIRVVVHQHIRAVSACYEEAIDARPGAMGKVLAEWDLDPSGGVHAVRVSEVDPSLEAIKPCLSREIASWTFPSGLVRETATVKYPFMFDERRPLR